jgi:glycosyltransferase involved in cell wall biosynthesis
MKIGIDISQIVYQTGVSNYTRNLVKKILELDRRNDYVLFGGSLRKMAEFAEFKKLTKTVISPFPPTAADFFWNRLHVWDFENLAGPVAVYHSSDWAQAPSRAKIIAPVYDLVVYKYPQTSHPAIIAAQKRRLAWVKKEAAAVVTISESSKQDIHEILQVPLEKIQVIYPAAGPEYRLPDSRPRPPKKYFLAVGTREPRKNLSRLIAAFQKASLGDMELWIAGPAGWGETGESQPGPNVKYLGFVSPQKMPSLYAGAVAFVYPSLYEGFGLPVLEALSCGTPVITSRCSSLPEAGGEAAVYVDPLDVEDIAAKLKEAAAGPKTSPAVLARQAAKFSWDTSARRMIEVYESLG